MANESGKRSGLIARGSELLIRFRWVYLGLCAVLTILFCLSVRHVAVRTVFSDFVPTGQPITDVFNKYRNFGNPLLVQLLVKAEDGAVFTPEGLGKVFRLTQAVDLIPGVDHEHVISIASPKIRMTRATPNGVMALPVMEDEPPHNQEEADEVHRRARAAKAVYGILVSSDESAALIEVGFREGETDYEQVFQAVNKLLDKESDAKYRVVAAGRVMLVGWVYLYGRQAFWIFIVSLLIIGIMHFDYMRSFTGAATPLIAATVSTIWGVGAAGVLGINIDPMTLVIPVLLTARALSHSVQMTRRYYEVLYYSGNKIAAATASMQAMFVPALLAILCDAIGLYFVWFAPIPLLKKLAILYGTWSLLLIPTIEFLTPVLLAVLPPPRDVSIFITRTVPSLSTRIIGPAQRLFAETIAPRWRWITLTVTIASGIVAGVYSLGRPVGNVAVGSPLLFANHEFNNAEREINASLAGTTSLNVIWEGKVKQAVRTAAVNNSISEFQDRIEDLGGAATTLSLADYVSPANALINGGNPKWLPVDNSNAAVGGTISVLTLGSSVRNLSRVTDYELKDACVTLWYKDLKHSTVNHAIETVKKALGPLLGDGKQEFAVRLGAGPVALQYVTDEVVERADKEILFYLLIGMFVVSALTYGSAVAAAILMAPLLLSQFFTGMVMYFYGIGLDLNTLPVNAIGLGVGIDYGIYLLSRICDEYQSAGDGDVTGASARAVDTAGEATLFVAATITLGVLPWYFLASLKFLSDLGFMLVLTMAFNAIMAMIVVPLQVVLLKPKFLARVRLMRHA
jgi:predicted RND superfamily exporter protein